MRRASIRNQHGNSKTIVRRMNTIKTIIQIPQEVQEVRDLLMEFQDFQMVSQRFSLIEKNGAKTAAVIAATDQDQQEGSNNKTEAEAEAEKTRNIIRVMIGGITEEVLRAEKVMIEDRVRIIKEVQVTTRRTHQV